MAYAKSYAIAFTTDASGDAVVYSGTFANGRLVEVIYTYDDAATGADFTCVGRTTGKALLTITNAATSTVTWRPRDVIHPVANTGAGSALTYDGTNEIYEGIWLVDEEIQVTVAQGGDTKSGTLTFIVD
jgi:hypothetical protein